MKFRRYRPPPNSLFPKSDHCNGRTFFNPNDPLRSSGFDLLKWKVTSDPVPWPREVLDLVQPSFAAETTEQEVTVTLVGHSTFLLQFGGQNILTDPVWSERCSPVSWAGPKRVRPPAIHWDDLPHIHAVLLSHNHYDHCDIPTLKKLHARFRPQILTGLGNRPLLEFHGIDNVVELDWWGKISLTPQLDATFCPAMHWSNRGGGTLNSSLWGAFRLATPSRSIYFAGDSGYGPHFKETRQRLGDVDWALLPIGAYEPRWFMKSMHMNPAEAVAAHLDLGAGRSIGMHFGTWQLTDEGIDEPKLDLKAAMIPAELTEATFTVPNFGETMSFSR